MKIIRVFPRRTNATPTDELAFSPPNEMPMSLIPVEADAVHISVTFTEDLPKVDALEKQWRQVAPVTIGGPATGQRGEAFTPGMYLRHGYTITSRGCPNRCWFCSVPKREGNAVRELPVRDGWNVLDDNLLACSDQHVREVFSMLARQKEKPAFTGGLEAARLMPWHCAELRKLRPVRMYFAFDTPDDRDPLFAAGEMLFDAGFTMTSHVLSCYVLTGYPKDTTAAAEKRMIDAWQAGFVPFSMLYKADTRPPSREWQKFQRRWVRPHIVLSQLKPKTV